MSKFDGSNQTRDGKPDTKLEKSLDKVEAGAKNDGAPARADLPAPDHRELPAHLIEERLAPDGGPRVRGHRHVLTTQPVIGPVEGNIPMPDPELLVAYPWAQMGAGDSFHVTGTTKDILMAAAASHAKDTKSDARYMAHEQQGGVRIWRVA